MTRRAAAVVWVLVGLTGLPAATLTLLRWAGPDSAWAVQTTAFAPFAVAPYTLALIVLGVALLRGLALLPGSVVAGLLAAGLVLHVCWLAPLFVGGRPQPADGAQEVVMMSSNVLKGRADAGAVADEVRAAGVDVLVLTEVTLAFEQRLGSTGISEELPFAVGTLDGKATITMVLSSTPIRILDVQDRGYDALVVDTAGMTLLAAHAAPPTHERIEEWHADHTWILDAARELHADVVIGDLNATLDHEPMRRLVGAGWRDAEELVNGGFAPTWPALGKHGPWPVVQIDHVMAADTIAVMGVDVVEIRGTDHLAVVATVASAA